MSIRRMLPKRRLRTLLAASPSLLLLARPAEATFLGLTGSIFPETGAPLGRLTYKIAAVFDNPNDYLLSVSGTPDRPMVIQSRNFFNTGPGSAFFNPIISHGTAPTPVEVFGGMDANTNPIPPVANAKWDTFFTIGVGAGQSGTGPGGVNQTQSLNAPANFVTGTEFISTDASWYTDGPTEQGRAGWPGDGDANLKVLIMQLVVSSTSAVRGTVNLTFLSGGEVFAVSGATFGTPPSPGSLALLGVGAFGASRRRRRH